MNKLKKYIKYKFLIDEKYKASIKIEDMYCLLIIEFENYIDFKKYENVTSTNFLAYILPQKRRISFINCEIKEIECSSNDKYKIKYIIDRIFDSELIDLSRKDFDNVTITFDDIEWFTQAKAEFISDDEDKSIVNIYSFKEAKLKIKQKDIKTKNTQKINYKTKVDFNFKFKNKKSFNEIIEYVYKFRNLLMIFGRRYINITSIIILKDKKYCNIYDCINEYNYCPISLELKRNLNYLCIKLYEIDNFDKIITNFYNIYEKRESILNEYFDSIKYKMSKKIRFVNSTMMVEDFADLFFKESRKNEQVREDCEYKSKIISDIIKILKESKYIDIKDESKITNELDNVIYKSKNLTFQSALTVLMRKVNEILNFREKELMRISKNIKKARKLCIHKGETANKYSFYYLRYMYFIEDLILLNIYKQIDLNIVKDSNHCFLNFYYTKAGLKKEIN